jgi:hypothetical protein
MPELESDGDAAMGELRHFAALAAQLMRLVTLFSTGAIEWTHPRDQDPRRRKHVFQLIALAINEFGGAADVWPADLDGVASLYATLQMFERADALPLSAFSVGALDGLVDRCWTPAGEAGLAWKASLRRLAQTAVVLGAIEPPPSAAFSRVPSSWIVWQLDEVVSQSDVAEAYIALGLPELFFAPHGTHAAAQTQMLVSPRVKETFCFLPLSFLGH